MDASSDFWTGRTVVVTGGTGSFGNALCRSLLADHVRSIRVVSRDEFKQYEQSRRLNDDRLRFILGDVRDRDRLRRAFDGSSVVVHAAALKQVPAGERDPLEFIKTNVLGAANVIEAAIDAGVERVIALSTDKACAPVTLYGATKLAAEKALLAANGTYGGRTRFSCVRYGNVAGSRGSVIPLFLGQKRLGVPLTITDERMTRFWLTLGEAVAFVRARLEAVDFGGSLFVPKIPSVRMVDVAEAIDPGAEHLVSGIRPGEKLHEAMISVDESRYAADRGDHFAIRPGTALGHPDFAYDSGSNPKFLTVDEIRERIPVALEEAGL